MLPSKPAGQRRNIVGQRVSCPRGRGPQAGHPRPPGRVPSQSRAADGEPCCGSPQIPCVEATRMPPAPRRETGRAHAGPRAARGQCEHHWHAVERTPNVLEAAQSGRQPFATTATAGVDDRPPASRHHPVPESVPSSPALHIRLVGAFHKFLQDRGPSSSGAALQASPPSRSPPRYGLAQDHDNQSSRVLHINNVGDNGNMVNTSP